MLTLTNKILKDAPVYNYRPKISYGEQRLRDNAALHFDLPHTLDTHSFGIPSISAGNQEISPTDLAPYQDAEIFDFIVKYPGETTHRIPKQLGPGLAAHFMACASMEFAASPYAKDKIGVILLRAEKLSKNVYLSGRHWHIHRFPTQGVIDRSTNYARNLSDTDWALMNSASPFMMADEFFNATICGTEIQTARAQSRINENAVQYGDAIKTHDFTYRAPFEYRQINPNEIVIGTGSWHRSQIPKPEHHFKTRLFAVMAYLHTNDSYLKWAKDPPEQAAHATCG